MDDHDLKVICTVFEMVRPFLFCGNNRILPESFLAVNDSLLTATFWNDLTKKIRIHWVR